MEDTNIKCDNCGKCCQDMFIRPLWLITPDIKKWLELHNVEVIGDLIRIPIPCTKLKDKKCSDYENRPEVCRVYNCENDKSILRYMFGGNN